MHFCLRSNRICDMLYVFTEYTAVSPSKREPQESWKCVKVLQRLWWKRCGWSKCTECRIRSTEIYCEWTKNRRKDTFERLSWVIDRSFYVIIIFVLHRNFFFSESFGLKRNIQWDYSGEFGSFDWIFGVHYICCSYIWKSRCHANRSLRIINHNSHRTDNWNIVHDNLFRLFRAKGTADHFIAGLCFWTTFICFILLSEAKWLRIISIRMGACNQSVICHIHCINRCRAVDVHLYGRTPAIQGTCY